MVMRVKSTQATGGYDYYLRPELKRPALLIQGSAYWTTRHSSEEAAIFVEVCFLVSARDLYTDTCSTVNSFRRPDNGHASHKYLLPACNDERINLRVWR